MTRRACLLLVGAIGLALASPARAQVGDPPPPPAPLDDVPPLLDDVPADPADEGIAPEPAPLPPSELPSPAGEPSPLPPPDDVVSRDTCPSAPAWPLAGAAAGLAGGATFATGAAGLLAISWWARGSAPGNALVPIAVLVGATTLPFLAGLGAGAVMLPLGRPIAPSHFLELCGVCGASWALSLCIVGAAVGGGSLGCSPGGCGGGGCDDGLGLGDGLDERPDVYWAAIGAGVGAAAGAALTWLAIFGLRDVNPSVEGELFGVAQVAGGATLGALALGALGGVIGAQEYEEELAATAPARCRERE